MHYARRTGETLSQPNWITQSDADMSRRDRVSDCEWQRKTRSAEAVIEQLLPFISKSRTRETLRKG